MGWDSEAGLLIKTSLVAGHYQEGEDVGKLLLSLFSERIMAYVSIMT